jgi:hypothetical protein
MKINNFMIAIVASVIVFASACSSENTNTKSGHEHQDGDAHKHTEVAENKGVTKKTNKYENELGQALDKDGNFITGCPSHKEMIGIEGDQCPKCGYMTMLPITWSLEGIDTIRVTSLTDYKPLVKKQ